MTTRRISALTLLTAILVGVALLYPEGPFGSRPEGADSADANSSTLAGGATSFFGQAEDSDGTTSSDRTLELAVSDAESYELLRMFVETLDQVENHYVQDLSRRELMEAAIEGMLSKLDDHSDYISPDELDGFRTGVEAEFGGIGIQVSKPTPADELRITNPMPDTPASRAGVLAGDVITHVNGGSMDGLSLLEAVDLLKGPIGTSVDITVRHSDGQIEEMEIERETIRFATVLGHERRSDGSWHFMVDDQRKLAYVRITSFARHTHEELEEVLSELEADDVKGLVLDLRLNPGGLLASAIEVSDLFVDEGDIVSTSGRNVTRRSYEAHAEGTFDGFPIAVLVDRFSASASEIVAACLQDHERGVVIGERTYGKGSVQNVVELNKGRSALKLTTAHYLRPNGKSIHRFPDATEDDDWGVRPNAGFEVDLSLRDLRRLALVLAQREAAVEPHLLVGFEDMALERALDHLADSPDEP